ncbi:hypothetical protein ABVF61_03075 [Roseibium sp. HPY-6]|uniref:hypothetical protein n=1 Tax=Roseibium sp. HPY-6 TaxID=3229852 RepID=UPI00338E15FA
MKVDTNQIYIVGFATGKFVKTVVITGVPLIVVAFAIYKTLFKEDISNALHPVELALAVLTAGVVVLAVTCVRNFGKPILEIGPAGYLDRRCFRKPIPWSSIRGISSRTITAGRSTLTSLVFQVDNPETLNWRPIHRWMHWLSRKAGSGELFESHVNMLAISGDTLEHIVNTYADAWGQGGDALK